jgi:hypothetical protein
MVQNVGHGDPILLPLQYLGSVLAPGHLAVVVNTIFLLWFLPRGFHFNEPE